MKKKIAILGSTGSIGKSTLEVIKKDKKNFDVVLLTANNNYKKLIQQAKEFNVKNVLIRNEKFYNKTYNIGSNKQTTVIDLANMIIDLTNSKSKIDFISSVTCSRG